MHVSDHDARLSRALAGVGYPPSVIDKALEGYWSDFKAPLVTPKLDLVEMLRRDGHEELARRVIRGEFDG